MKFLLSLLIFFSLTAYSQSADFIQLKKKGKIIHTFFAGSAIEFTTTSGSHIAALINGIKNDSLYLQEFVMQYIPTIAGTYILDTIGSYHYKFNYHQINAIGAAPKHGFNFKGSGASLFGGGILLTLASGVIYLADRKKFSSPLLIAAVGLGTLGYFWAKSGGKGFIIGKKYTLAYVDMSNTKL
jgi:hypothetical protein